MEFSVVADHYEEIKNRINDKSAKVAIIGAGYVGLSLSIQLAKANYKVCAYDLDETKVNSIRNGISYIEGVSDIEIEILVNSGMFESSVNLSDVNYNDVIIVCVPTPITVNKEPDVSSLKKAVETICENLHSSKLIIIESTTYPGTTSSLVLSMIEEKGKVIGEDIFLAHSPERVDFGNTSFTRNNVPKIVGGITEKCTRLTVEFYKKIVEVVPVSNSTVAEMVKLFENTYRVVNIGLVNEFTLLCDRMKLNTWDILDAAFTKPYGIQPFYPGPGVGGHCIPVDPYYLLWKAKEYDFNFRSIQLATDINSNMPYYVIEKLSEALSAHKKVITDSTILILGVAYKKDISDYRTSPAVKIIELLQKKNVEIIYHDPYISEIEISKNFHKSIPFHEINWELIDSTLIITDHSNIDYQKLVDHSRLVIDTRNATKNIKDNDNKIILL